MDDLGLRRALAHHATALDDRAPAIAIDEIEARASRSTARRAPQRRRPVVAVAIAAAVVLAIVVSVALVRADDRDASSGTGPASRGPTARALSKYDWSELPTPSYPGRFETATVWTGHEVIVWGGRTPVGNMQALFPGGSAFDPSTQTWRNVPNAPLSPRAGAAAVWTGHEMFVWGGGDGGPVNVLADGAMYDPRTDSWRALPPSPLSARTDAEAVWTGKEVLVTGGLRRDGDGPEAAPLDTAAYDPKTGRWRRLPAMPTRAGHPVAFTTSLWIGTRLLVWQFWEVPGGRGPSAVGIDAVSYNPSTRRWREIPRAKGMPRTLYQPVWTGREVLVPPSSIFASGGPGYRGTEGGFRYDPRTNRWHALPPGPLDSAPGAAVWTGRALVTINTSTTSVGGPGGRGLVPGDGAAFDPQTNRWYTLRRPPDALDDNTTPLVWTGHELIVASPLAPDGSGGGLRLSP